MLNRETLDVTPISFRLISSDITFYIRRGRSKEVAIPYLLPFIGPPFSLASILAFLIKIYKRNSV